MAREPAEIHHVRADHCLDLGTLDSFPRFFENRIEDDEDLGS